MSYDDSDKPRERELSAAIELDGRLGGEGLAAAIDRIAALTTAAREARILELPGQREYAIQGPDGLETRETPANYRDHYCEDLDSLVRLAATASEDSGADPAIWYHAGTVSLVWDVADRRNAARMGLTHSRQWLQLLALERSETPKNWPLRRLVSMLRLTLGAPEALVKKFRNVAWRGSQHTAAVVGHGKESLGRSIESAVSGEGDLPEEFDLQVPVWEHDGLRWPMTVRILVEINHEEQTFALLPAPGALAVASAEARRCLRAELDRLVAVYGIAETVPVYHGSP